MILCCGPVSLVPKILWLSGYNIACLQIAVVYVGLVQAVLPPTLPWLTHDWLTALQYSQCGICSQHCVPLVSMSISVVSLFPSTLPRTFLWHIPPSVNIGNRTKLSIQVTVILDFFLIKQISIYLPEYLNSCLPAFPTFHVPCKLEWGFCGVKVWYSCVGGVGG